MSRVVIKPIPKPVVTKPAKKTGVLVEGGRPKASIKPVAPSKSPINRGTFSGVAYEDFGGMGFLDFNKLLSDAQTSLQTAASKLVTTEISKIGGSTSQPVMTVTQQQLPANVVYMNQPQGPSFFEENKNMIMIAGASVAALLLGLIVYKVVKK